ncbi:unnamed protein product [Rangifer tarandus platyrhynchus]|uniref:Uncharacterized protein n=2 Tax=Rangifer tarandus platyrhynchus TaxID=3082113 RepID=A0AC59YR86_RANTA|nr:unnamed protein product [Rangifer tarandus platyrhynchus]
MTSLALTIPIAHLLSSSSLHIPDILLIICSLHSNPLRDGMPVSSSCLRNYTLKGIYVSISFPGGTVVTVKNLPANEGDASWIPGSGRSPGVGNGNPLHLVWEIPWKEESGGLQSMELKRFRHD